MTRSVAIAVLLLCSLAAYATIFGSVHGLIHEDAPTVNGATMGENCRAAATAYAFQHDLMPTLRQPACQVPQKKLSAAARAGSAADEKNPHRSVRR